MHNILPAAVLALLLALAGCGVFEKRSQAPAAVEPPVPEQASAVAQEAVPAKPPAKQTPAPVPMQQQPSIAMFTPDTYDTARELRDRKSTRLNSSHLCETSTPSSA